MVDNEMAISYNEAMETVRPFRGRAAWVLWLSALPLIFALSGLWHFLYVWLPYPVINVIAPVSESVWEHEKIIFYPMVLWYVIVYFAFHRKFAIAWRNWFLSAGVATATAMVSIILIYYSLSYAFGVPELLVLDMLYEIASIVLGMSIGAHVYLKNSHPSMVYLGIGLLGLGFVLLTLFTFLVPQLSIFLES
jgi:hypothetical protein